MMSHEVRISDWSSDVCSSDLAGKTSMLNVINGFYHPQQGRIEFRGVERRTMRPHVAARQGIARTFQNVALFKGMSTLDNIMNGRVRKMKSNLFQQETRSEERRVGKECVSTFRLRCVADL